MNIEILQPKNCDISKIRHEIVQESNKILDTAIYPNGFILIFEQIAGSVNVKTNRPLIRVSENVYQIPD